MIPNHLMSVAMLGTGQNELSGEIPVSPQAQALLEQVDSGNTEPYFLTAMTLLTQQAQVAANLPRLPHPPQVVESSENQPKLTKRVTQTFFMGMKESDKGYLRAWLKRAVATGKVAPDELQPFLLNLGAKTPDLQPLILPLISAKGLWVGTQNAKADWTWADFREPEKIWAEGKLNDRVRLLKHFRRQDPDLAREWLEAVWQEYSAAERAKLLAPIEIGLSMADEPFLENCLDDKAGAVRETASELLSHLPESRFVARMIARAKTCVSYEREQISFSARKPEPDERDGITEKKTPHQRLVYILERIPPRYWCEAWRISFEKLYEPLRTATESDWGEIFLKANLNFAQDSESLQEFYRAGRIVMLTSPSRQSILKALSDDFRFSEGLKHLMTSTTTDGFEMAMSLLAYADSQWTEPILQFWSEQMQSPDLLLTLINQANAFIHHVPNKYLERILTYLDQSSTAPVWVNPMRRNQYHTALQFYTALDHAFQKEK